MAMIALSAVLAGWESVDKLFNGATVTYPWVVATAGVVGFIGNELVAVYRIKVGRRIGSAALVADGLHARTDGFTSLAVVAGALGVILGFPLADPIVGILITIAILVVLRGAARDVYRRLMDAIDPEVTEAAERTLLGTPGVVGVERTRLRWIGHRIVADASISVDSTLGVVAAHDIANEAHHRLLHEVPKLTDVTIHVSPEATIDIDRHEVLAHHVQNREARGPTARPARGKAGCTSPDAPSMASTRGRYHQRVSPPAPVSSPPALRVAGLVVVLAGLFGMHVLGGHSAASMSMPAPSPKLMTAPSMSIDVSDLAATSTGVVSDVGLLAGNQMEELLDAATDSGHGGMAMGVMCMAIVGVALLALLRLRLRARVTPVVWSLPRCTTVIVPRGRDPDPPSLIKLSIQRC